MEIALFKRAFIPLFPNFLLTLHVQDSHFSEFHVSELPNT